jgi:hypothetical protein
MIFKKCRLEGRALEHEFAGCRRPGIRMYDEERGSWVVVRSKEAQEIRASMRFRGKCHGHY